MICDDLRGLSTVMQLRHVVSVICILFVFSAVGHASRRAAEENSATAGGRSQQPVIKASRVSELFDEDIVEDFSWHPVGSKILMAKHSPEHAGHRLIVCDPKTRKITLFESQPMDQKSVSGVWSAGGRQIAFSSTPNLKPVPWFQNGERGMLIH